MSGREGDSDSDPPEELTAEQALREYEEVTRIQRESKARVARERKERNRKWAERFTPKPKSEEESNEDEIEVETHEVSQLNKGMLPQEVVAFLAAREKKVFAFDSEDEETETKSTLGKRRKKKSGPVILKDIPPPPCLQNSLDFQKKRKMQVSRSSAVLDNSNQALRLLSSSGLLLRNNGK